jgi:hypothetical protein
MKPYGDGDITVARRKVAGSSLDVVIEFFSIYLILPAAQGPGILKQK